MKTVQTIVPGIRALTLTPCLAAMALASAMTACGGASSDAASETSSTVDSQISSQLKEHYSECIISGVLSQRLSFEEAKESCLQDTMTHCKQITSGAAASRCESQVAAATERILKDGIDVECDSGYCVILMR
jgi:hypothetical protein